MDKYMTGIEVPDWVNWIAVDKNGDIWGFEQKPNNSGDYFWDVDNMSNVEYLESDSSPKNWKEELYKWE